MCNCIKDIEQKIKGLYPNAESVEYMNVELLSGRVYSKISIKIPDKKKPQEQLVLHTYCPTCGKKYDE